MSDEPTPFQGSDKNRRRSRRDPCVRENVVEPRCPAVNRRGRLQDKSGSCPPQEQDKCPDLSAFSPPELIPEPLAPEPPPEIFTNAEQTLECSDLDEFATHPDVALLKGSPFSVTILAGEFSSVVSQQDADDQALNFAELELDCFWGNDEQSVDCTDIGDSDTAPDANNPLNPVVIPEDFIRSTVSQQDADDQAEALGISELLCFWVNDEQSVDCTDGDPAKEGVAGAANNPLNPVVIEAGRFLSLVSKAQANEQAFNQGLASLICFWDNEEYSNDCQTLHSSGTIKGTPDSVVVPASQFFSFLSQADADDQAETFGDLSLNCFWESQAKAYTCADIGKTGTASGSNNGDNPIQAAEGWFTSQISQADADSQVESYVSTVLTCFWGNDEQVVDECPEGPPVLVFLQEGRIPEDTIPSFLSKADANTQALALATASVICVDEDLIGGGPPGQRGPSGNCDTPCAAFYA